MCRPGKRRCDRHRESTRAVEAAAATSAKEFTSQPAERRQLVGGRAFCRRLALLGSTPTRQPMPFKSDRHAINVISNVGADPTGIGTATSHDLNISRSTQRRGRFPSALSLVHRHARPADRWIGGEVNVSAAKPCRSLQPLLPLSANYHQSSEPRPSKSTPMSRSESSRASPRAWLPKTYSRMSHGFVAAHAASASRGNC